MLGIHDLPLFVAAGLLLNLTPGVDFLYVLGRGASRGFAAGVWAALGIGAGCFVHIVAAALGLSAVLASSASAFAVVKWVGAAYLIYVGFTMVRQRARGEITPARTNDGASMRKVFWQGFATNVLNPKVALFFLAFMPQFIRPEQPLAPQYIILTATVVGIDIIVMWFIFAAGAKQLKHLTTSERGQLILNRIFGILFIGVGILLALI